jgi:hypothetical protein
MSLNMHQGSHPDDTVSAFHIIAHICRLQWSSAFDIKNCGWVGQGFQNEETRERLWLLSQCPSPSLYHEGLKTAINNNNTLPSHFSAYKDKKKVECGFPSLSSTGTGFLESQKAER